ncbi:MAG: hypothetical protein U0936_27140 [Planctomycetaceae bacterium]
MYDLTVERGKRKRFWAMAIIIAANTRADAMAAVNALVDANGFYGQGAISAECLVNWLRWLIFNSI